MADRLGDKARLKHIIDAIDEIRDYTDGLNGFQEFRENSMAKNASIRQLEIIGEACNRLSDGLKNENPDIAWRQIIGLRNTLIHQYFGVDDKIVWDVIENELGSLKKRAKKMLEDIK